LYNSRGGIKPELQQRQQWSLQSTSGMETHHCQSQSWMSLGPVSLLMKLRLWDWCWNVPKSLCL